MKRPWLWASLGLLGLIAWSYWPAARLGFVGFDDTQYIVQNRMVARGLSREGVAWAFTTPYAANWFPLTWLSHMLDVQLYGKEPAPQHVMNVVWHAANTLLLFGALARMTGRLWRSATVAALFAVHPLHVESVAWLAERKDVLSGFFCMLTLWAYAEAVRRPGPARSFPVALFFGLGLMAKPMLVTLPFVLLLLDYWPLGRVAERTPRRLALEKLPLLALSAASGIVTFLVQRSGGAVKGLDAFPLHRRVANATLAYVGYIQKTLWPTRLAAIYPYPAEFAGWQVAAAAATLLAATVLAVRAGRRCPYLPVGWLWYAGMLVPVIGLIQVGSQPMADRYTYLPLIGLLVVAVWGVSDLASASPGLRRASAAVAALAIAACTLASRRQVDVWKDGVTLWEHAIAVTTDNYRAHSNLANTLAKAGRTDDASRHYAEALRLRPGFPEALGGLGVVRLGQGRQQEAIELLTSALRALPDDAEANNNLGVALMAAGKLDEAVPLFEAALRRRPDLADTQANLGYALAHQGKLDEARRHLGEAVRLRPEDAAAKRNLGVVLANRGRFAEAAVQYREALRLQPNDALAHNSLGAALADMGKPDAAIAEYGEALRLDPSLADAHANLGTALAGRDRLEEAIHEFSEALRLRPLDADTQYDVAVLLARKGRMADAVSHLREALRIDPNHKAARHALDQLTEAGAR